MAGNGIALKSFGFNSWIYRFRKSLKISTAGTFPERLLLGFLKGGLIIFLSIIPKITLHPSNNKL